MKGSHLRWRKSWVQLREARMSPHEGKCYKVGWPCFWTQSTKLRHINYFSIEGLSWELLDKKMAGLHTYLCVCMCGQVCTWHVDVYPQVCAQAMGKSVLFIHAAVPPPRPITKKWGNQFCSSVQQPPRPAPTTRQEGVSGGVSFPHKDEK